MSKFQLHTWGALGQLQSFDPDCLAAIWYLSLVAKNEFEVVASSNTWIDHTEQLPALVHNGKTVGGIKPIIRYLKSEGYDLDSSLSAEEQGKVTGLVSYITSNVSVLSLYTLYLQRQNYEDVVRPHLSRLLPFPMQYNAATKQHELATSRCTAAGFNDPEGKQTVEDGPSLGKLQEQIEAKHAAHKKALADAKENLKALTFGAKVYGIISKEMDVASINTADVMLLAHLTVQMSHELPNPIVRDLIETQFPQLLSYYTELIDQVDNIKVETREPVGREVPNLYNTVMQTLGY